MKPLFSLASLASLAVAFPGFAGSKPAPELSKSAFKKLLASDLNFAEGNHSVTLHPDGTADFTSAFDGNGPGSWQADKAGNIRASVTTDERPWELTFENCWATTGLVVCGNVTMPAREGWYRYDGSYAVRVVPAAGSGKLYAATLEKLSGTDGYVVIDGLPAKDPRTSSEIWFQRDNEEAAKRLATELAPLLGTIEPKRWTFGGAPYDLIVVVGPESSGTLPKKLP